MDNYDVIVIGGGATGLGVALEAQSRGYKTILFEAHDFGKGTSSKSTKLIHGGIRYLANLDFGLVHEGLSERFHFLNNVPHIAKIQGYMVPFYTRWDKLKYFIGINLYSLLSGSHKIGHSSFLNKNKTRQIAPELRPKHLLGSAIYYDGQFDDTRVLVSLLRTFQELGGVIHNYHEVISLNKDNASKITGVTIQDKLANKTFSVNAKVIINATGTLTDTILDMDEPDLAHKHVAAAQGTHLVFDKEVFNSTDALVIPKTTDGRILFVLPWHNKIVVGTTDLAVDKPTLDPKALDVEIDFILDTFNQYTVRTVTRLDIRSVFTGQRPLVKPNNKTNSAKISRKHEILYSQSGIISIVGGKWTIYRKMGEDTIDFAINKGLLPSYKSITKTLHLFGYTKDVLAYPLSVYGSDAYKISQIQTETDNYALLHPDLPYLQAEVIYQVRYEMAKTVEDILARRTRALFLNAKAAIDSANIVAELMALEMEMNQDWVTNQVTMFTRYARQYQV